MVSQTLQLNNKLAEALPRHSSIGLAGWPGSQGILKGQTMKYIPLTQGKFAIVDDEDFEKLNKNKWSANLFHKTYYAFCGGKIRKYMHREIMGLKNGDEKVIDHKNFNGLDNRKENLRICNFNQNTQHGIFSPGKSGFTGIFFNKKCSKRKYTIHISFNNKLIYGGAYSELKYAIKYRNCMARILHGEFANIIALPPC